MKPEDCIFFNLAKASQAGTRFWAEKVAQYDVTAVQAMALNFLYDNDRITSSDLGKMTGLDSATLTGILDRLETAGLVERKQHPRDRRAIQVCLTAKGKDIASKTHALIDQANKEFLAGMSSGERDELKKLLKRVRT
jgi:DNA-binding MarR family transcriptional regulator